MYGTKIAIYRKDTCSNRKCFEHGHQNGQQSHLYLYNVHALNNVQVMQNKLGSSKTITTSVENTSEPRL